MSVETDLTTANNTTTQPPSAPTAPAPAQAASVPPEQPAESRMGVGRTSELLAKASAAFDLPDPKKAAPPAPDSASVVEGEVEANGANPPQQSNDLAPVPDELTRLKEENANYQRRFQEVETARQSAQVQELTHKQRTELQEVINDQTATTQTLQYKNYQIQTMAQELQAATEERDYDAVDALKQSIAFAQYEAQLLERSTARFASQAEQMKNYYQSQYDNDRTVAQTQAIENIAKKYGVTMEDLKKAAPDLKVTEYFKVLDTVARSIATAKDSRIAELESQLKSAKSNILAEVLEEFDNSPGAQPHRMGGATAGAQVTGIKMGNTGKLLEKAFAEYQ